MSEGGLVREIKGRISIDTSDLGRAGQATQRFAGDVERHVGGSAVHVDRATKSFKDAEGGAKRFEEAMHHGTITLGLYGENVEGLSRRLGGLQGLMSGGLGLGIGGLVGAGLVGGGIEFAKQAIENTEAQERAYASLEQSAAVVGRRYDDLKAKTQSLIETNSAYIADQYQAVNAMAMFTRAGLDEGMAAQALNVAIDLGAIKHLALGDSARMVQLALMGNGRAVRELGIDLKALSKEEDVSEEATKNLEASQKEVATAVERLARAQRALQEAEDGLHAKRTVSQLDLDHLKDKQNAAAAAQEALTAAQKKYSDAQGAADVSKPKQAKILEELESKTEGGREVLTPLQRSQNRLKQDFQDLSADAGPPLIQALDAGVRGADWVLQAAGGKNEEGKKGWQEINDAAVGTAKTLQDFGILAPKVAEQHTKATDVVTQQYLKLKHNVNGVTEATALEEEATFHTSERLDQQADIARLLDTRHGYLAESIARSTGTMTGFRDESDRGTDATVRARDSVDALIRKMEDNRRSNELAEQSIEEHVLGPMREIERQAGRNVAATQQSIDDIREAVAHASIDRLDIKVSMDGAAAAEAALKRLIGLEQDAASGGSIGITVGSGGSGFTADPATGTPSIARPTAAAVPSARAQAIELHQHIDLPISIDGAQVGAAVQRQVRRELAAVRG